MKVKEFYQLDAWKECHKLCLSLYKVTEDFPRTEVYGITNQLIRSGSSSTANIAEGFGHFHFANKIRFYRQARGSITEIQSFLILAKDLGYLDEGSFDKLWKQAKKCERLINGLIRSTKKLDRKYKES